uniref:Cnidarian restricted protein n=1 Tax=Clytia hemisphaerica TaxID=252671 RepID=A0A7M5WRQ2_9CNID
MMNVYVALALLSMAPFLIKAQGVPAPAPVEEVEFVNVDIGSPLCPTDLCVGKGLGDFFNQDNGISVQCSFLKRCVVVQCGFCGKPVVNPNPNYVFDKDVAACVRKIVG